MPGSHGHRGEPWARSWNTWFGSLALPGGHGDLGRFPSVSGSQLPLCRVRVDLGILQPPEVAQATAGALKCLQKMKQQLEDEDQGPGRGSA